MSTLAPSPPRSAASDLAERLAFLRDPASYGGAGASVQAVETHLSWVFLTREHAYKLKKPVRFDHLDLREAGARAAHCRMEMRLNRRFCEDVYLDVVPLTRGPRGALRLGGDGAAVDWLIRMRRLPADLMLDRLVARGEVRPRDIVAIAVALARFYRTCAPEPIAAADWRSRFIAHVSENVRELAMPASRVPATVVHEIGERQLEIIDRCGELLDRRVDDGLVVEGHGDLRPEHICLEAPPRIIDCLEFSRELRVVDAAEELGFLALECERLGAEHVKESLFAAYAAASGDAPPPVLVDFYQSHHACVRAKLALRHLADAGVREPQRWIARTQEYIALAAAHLCAAAKR
ncbi:MAG TPA: hypothetical protein VFP44_10575 [Usitatibacter sp.]|nr:hypothetical protein [Usitatibacter sp.]